MFQVAGSIPVRSTNLVTERTPDRDPAFRVAVGWGPGTKPSGFRYPKVESTFYIKRVIGLPGDQISYSEDGILSVNSQAVDETGYETKLSIESRPRAFGPVIVPQDRLFMMGDNRDNS